MKFTLPIMAAAGLASAYVSDYSFLEARGDLSGYEPRLAILARALEDFDADILARDPTSSRRGSTASSHEMQPLTRTPTSPSRSNSWDSIKPAVDSKGNKQSSGVGRAEGDKRDASKTHQAVNSAQRAGSYAKKNPLEAASSGLSAIGSALGAAGAIAGGHGSAHIAAGCAAGAACANGAANVIDKYRTAKKTASEQKGKRDLLARALMAEIAMTGAYPEIEARSYNDDIWADDYFY